MRYAAFISYSHAADGKLAPRLQSALHNFAKPWYRLRALRVFRDQTSLASNPDLWFAIEAALGESQWFLYMASPQAAGSEWGARNRVAWLEHRGSDKMLVLITEGELAWDVSKQDFDWSRSTCLPEELRRRFKGEPLYVDLRWARSEDNLSIRHLRSAAPCSTSRLRCTGSPRTISTARTFGRIAETRRGRGPPERHWQCSPWPRRLRQSTPSDSAMKLAGSAMLPLRASSKRRPATLSRPPTTGLSGRRTWPRRPCVRRKPMKV